MAFVTEKEELKPGLIIFRRGDVEHRMWYCRMKMPKADRYKTVSLKTSDKEAARDATSATAFGKSATRWPKPSRTTKPSAALRFSTRSASGF
jgi:hypothetical protein